MSRPKGSKNKQISFSSTYVLSSSERIDLIAGLLTEIVYEELWTDD